MFKTCTKCHQELSLTDFGKDACKRDGLRSACKSCNREVTKLWEARTAKGRAPKAKAWKAANRGLINASSFDWRRSESGSVSELLSQARKRAKKAGLPFLLTAADVVIPELCPVFGKPLARKTGKGPSPWSPSLDKIVPALGYVPGNVRVLSHKANLMKNDANTEELLLFAAWINATCQGNLA